MIIINTGGDFGLLVIFVSFMLLILIAIFEMFGLNTRINILVFSGAALALLVIPTLAVFMASGLRYTLITSGAVLALIVLLYGLATARRLRAWRWFMALLIGGVVTLLGLILLLNTQTLPYTGIAALMIVALWCLPAMCTLLYAARSPNFPTTPAMNPRRVTRRVTHRAR